MKQRTNEQREEDRKKWQKALERVMGKRDWIRGGKKGTRENNMPAQEKNIPWTSGKRK